MAACLPVSPWEARNGLLVGMGNRCGQEGPGRKGVAWAPLAAAPLGAVPLGPAQTLCTALCPLAHLPAWRVCSWSGRQGSNGHRGPGEAVTQSSVHLNL